MTYAEKLKDPRWQKKRLEIMDRDGFACRGCGNKDDTLNVHHSYYQRAREPWDHPSETLFTLCDKCHSCIEERMNYLRFAVGSLDPEVILRACEKPSGSQKFYQSVLANIKEAVSAMEADEATGQKNARGGLDAE